MDPNILIEKWKSQRREACPNFSKLRSRNQLRKRSRGRPQMIGLHRNIRKEEGNQNQKQSKLINYQEAIRAFIAGGLIVNQ
jgi:hypothetical protein